ncbi:hypothetical protein ACSBR2_035782 [Camellia fascicularis]
MPILTSRKKTIIKEYGDQNPGDKDVGKEGDAPKKSGRDEYYNESNLQVWKDRCLRRDDEIKGMANKLADLQSVVSFMMQNNVMQPPFPLQDMPMLRKGGRKQSRSMARKRSTHISLHGRSGEESRSKVTRRGHLVPGEHMSKNPEISREKGLCFDTVNEEKSKRTHNDTESSAPKRLKSADS